MPNHKSRRSADWRCRREEYLRASGRREDLISEGYESPGPAAKWALFHGDGRQPRKENAGIRLFIVKRGVL